MRFGGITTNMEFVSKPTAAVWEHFRLKANDRGEPIDPGRMLPHDESLSRRW